jgi:hypothetical protein
MLYGLVFAVSIASVATTHAAESAAPSRPNPAGMSVADIKTCMRANVVDRGSLRDFEITSTDREGKTNALKVKVFWQPKNSGDARMTLQVVRPETYAGTSYLLISKPPAQEVVYVYLPALGRVQPITGSEMSQPLWGTDFTFAEVKQVQGLLQEGETKREADASVLDRTAFVLDTITNAEQTGYTHVKSYVDQATCTLLKAELFSEGSSPRKVLEADISRLVEVEPWWLMLGYTMRDLSAGTHTDLKLSDVYLLEQLPQSLFTPEGFYSLQE